MGDEIGKNFIKKNFLLYILYIKNCFLLELTSNKLLLVIYSICCSCSFQWFSSSLDSLLCFALLCFTLLCLLKKTKLMLFQWSSVMLTTLWIYCVFYTLLYILRYIILCCDFVFVLLFFYFDFIPLFLFWWFSYQTNFKKIQT